jgi:pyruvate/2-oxoglutarate dehydrogenase complex dihydrolipoamide dehydrogenase (E3) component
MEREYDLIVIGAGSGGLSAAPLAAKLGARVALVEKYKPGGDCLYTGCVPSKALIKVARVAWEMRRASDFGLEPHRPPVDLGRVMAHVQDVIQRVYQFESPEVLAHDGVELVTGEARFLDERTVRAGERTLRAKRFIIATGSRAAVPPIPGLEGAGFLTYDDVFHLQELPKHLLVLGAGPIGMELAQAFRRLGSEVTMFQRSKRLLSMADPDCSEVLANVLREEGVQFHLGAELNRVESVGEKVMISTGADRIEGDRLLVAAGRTANVEGLDLERAGVAYGPRGIPVDEHLRTNQHHIYACGDVLGTHQFTHYAGMQGYVAVRNALFPGNGTGVLEQVPWTIFTDPEVARVGLTEPEARERHDGEVQVTRWPIERIDRAQAEEDRHGFIKVIHKSGGEILGAHIVAGRAGEMIHEFVLAMDRGLKLSDLSGAMHVYPTYSVGNQQAAVSWRVDNLVKSTAGRLLTTAARWTR